MQRQSLPLADAALGLGERLIVGIVLPQAPGTETGPQEGIWIRIIGYPPRQKDVRVLMQAFLEAGLSNQFYVDPGLEHAILHDLAEILRQAVDFITQ